MPTLETYLKQFQQVANTAVDFPLYQYKGGQSGFTIHLSGIIHGNEVGSLPTLVALVQDLESGAVKFRGNINISLGNPEASKLNRRFVDADLNRLFLRNQPSEHIHTHEAVRARQLMPWLDKADVILDLHQTMLASEMPFYIFPKTDLSLAIVEAIGGTLAYIDATPSEDAPLYQCADEYVWRRGKPALTLELGEAGFHAPATNAASQAVRGLIGLFDEWLNLHHASDINDCDALITHIKQRSLGSLTHYQTIHREPYHSPEHRLKSGLINFVDVQQGDILSAPNSPEMIAPCTGKLLFPKYPRRNNQGKVIETLPKEIYRIIQEA